MADERDLELLDDYLTNRLSEQDRSAFEQKLKADVDLQQEYALQKRLVESIKKARVTELKSMLNNVPIPANGTGNALGTKIALGTVATLIIAGAAYWFTRDEQDLSAQKPQLKTEEHIPSTANRETTESPAKSEKAEPLAPSNEQTVVETDKNQTSAGTEHSKPSLAKRPDPLSAPAAKNADRSKANDGFTPAAPSLTIETQVNNPQYTFHYQLLDGKLSLYGPFQNNYKVMEYMVEGRRAAFLHYDNKFYALEEGAQAKPLTPVTDPALLQKLSGNK